MAPCLRIPSLVLFPRKYHLPQRATAAGGRHAAAGRGQSSFPQDEWDHGEDPSPVY